jgi:hypothetical protein
MGLRFYRRVRILPGIRLNFTGRGTSISFGARGAWYTIGRNGRRTATLGWPGTGLRYTTTRKAAPSAVGTVVLLLLLGLAVWIAFTA